jgi:hypothetical protein
MPRHELMSIIEYIFNGSVSMVYKAFWSRDISKVEEDNEAYQTSLKHLIQLKG